MSRFLTAPTTWLLKLYFLSSSEKTIPDYEFNNESTTSALLFPMHETIPIPVTTTLLMI